MIKPLGLLLVAALGASFVQAQTPTASATAAAPAPTPAPAAPEGPQWVVTPAFVSTYMFRGVRVNGLSFQPSVELDVGNAAIGVWASFPLANKTPGVSDPEVDPYVSYKIPVNDAFNFQPGFSLYTYPRAKTSAGSYKLTFEPYLAANYTVGPVTLTPKVYYDTVLRGGTYEFNATSAVPLKDLGTELDLTGTAGTYLWQDATKGSSPRTENGGNYWLLGVSVPYQVSKPVKVSIGYAYTKGTSNYFRTGSAAKTVNTSAVGRGVVTLSSTITF
ncbi:MAG TPA: hypothetical protein VG838_06130 [Opitutaceae bacterium]|nr:hypothetical protein [Opitutaceae bacterium]